MISHEPIYGAYTELYAGLDESIGETDNGNWGPWTDSDAESMVLTCHTVSPFGKFESNRPDLVDAELCPVR